MPTIPAAGYSYRPYPTETPRLSAGTPYQQLRPSADAFGAGVGQALTGLGQTIGQGADKLANLALLQQKEYNETVVREARNRTESEMNKLLYGDPDIPNSTGYFGLTGRSALDQRANIIKTLGELHERERRTLSNPVLQRMFDEGTERVRLHSQAQILQHSSREFIRYRDREADASVELRINEVGRAAVNNDTTLFKQSLGEAINTSETLMRAKGASDAEISLARSKITAAAVTSWVNGRKTTDPTGALRDLEDNEEHFTDKTAYAALHTQLKGVATKAAGRELAGSGSLWDRVKKAEGGVGPNGEALVSSKGAIGVSQILPGTAKEMAAELGLPYDPQRLRTDKKYNEMLGKAYLDKLLVAYSGNEVLATAAYNAGPGRVNEWIKEFGDPRTGTITNTQFAARIPFNETRNYVAKITGGGVARTDYQARVQRIRESEAPQEVKEAAIDTVRGEAQDTAIGQSNTDYEVTKRILSDDPAITPEFIDTLVKGGQLSPDDGKSKLTLLNRVREEKQKRADAIARVEGVGQGWPPLDPKSKNDRDAVGMHFEELAKQWSPGQFTERAIAYTEKYGLVPERLKELIRGKLHSGQPRQVIEGANIVARLRNTNPQLVNEIGDEADLRLAATVTRMTSAGVFNEEAVKRAIEGLKVTEPLRKARQDEFKEKRGKNSEERNRKDDNFLYSKENVNWFSDPAVESQMRAQFQELAELEFERTGDLPQSYDWAYTQLMNVWGRTQVTGSQERYVRYPPEKVYGLQGMTFEQNQQWMREQLAVDVGVKLGRTITADDILLIADETRRRKTGPDGRPAYIIEWRDSEGQWNTLFKENGEPLLWHPDWLRSPEALRLGAKGATDLEETRRRSRELRQGPTQAIPSPVY